MDDESMATPSQRQGLFREEWSGGNPMAKPGADVQEGDIRLSSGDEAAIDADVPWMGNRVNHTVVWGKRTSLSGEAFVIFLRKTLSPKGSVCAASDSELSMKPVGERSSIPGVPIRDGSKTSHSGGTQRASQEADGSEASAAAMPMMSGQKSAEGIVVNAQGNAWFMAKARTFHKGRSERT